jgi:SAM-dependent methyltransferase
VHDSDLTARQYDAMGGVYRDGNNKGSLNAYYERPATISLLGNVAGLRVLDAGCGPGALTEWLVEHGAAVTAVDVSPEMVRIARERVGDRARVQVADLADPLPLETGSVDVVVSSLAMHYITDWDVPLGEFRRVLTPDGAAVFSTHHPAMDWQMHSPGDYFAVRQVSERWSLGTEGGFDVTFWRRPLTAITESIYRAGFLIERLVEPAPVPELADVDTDDYRRLRTSPAFLFFRLVKRPA